MDVAVQSWKVAVERETVGVPERMSAIAPPFGALQEVNEVAGLEDAIVRVSPVERDARMAAPEVVVHLTNEKVQPVSDVVVCLSSSGETVMMGDEYSTAEVAAVG